MCSEALLQSKNVSPGHLKYCRCSVFIKENGTTTGPFRHSKERAFHPICLILFRKIRYRTPFSVCKDNTRGFRGPFSVLQVPSNHSLEFGRAPKGLELSQAPNTSKPATTRPRNSIQAPEKRKTNGADPSSVGASHPQTRSAGNR